MEDDLSLVNGLSFAFKKRGASGSDGGGIQAFVPFYAESKRGAVQGTDLGKPGDQASFPSDLPYYGILSSAGGALLPVSLSAVFTVDCTAYLGGSDRFVDFLLPVFYPPGQDHGTCGVADRFLSFRECTRPHRM